MVESKSRILFTYDWRRRPSSKPKAEPKGTLALYLLPEPERNPVEDVGYEDLPLTPTKWDWDTPESNRVGLRFYFHNPVE